MNSLQHKYEDVVTGCLSGFDRLILRGTLMSIVYPEGLQAHLNQRNVLLKDFDQYAKATTDAVRSASMAMACEHDRPVRYLESAGIKKGPIAEEIARVDGIHSGLVCLLKCVEPCQSFQIYRNRETKRLELRSQRRQCLFHYLYYIHPTFGFMHLRIQTWLPFGLSVWINGRRWLAQQMDACGLGYIRRGNTFIALDDVEQAQRLANAQVEIDWQRHLNDLVDMLHPAHTILFPEDRYRYYWSVAESEWATDLMFRSAEDLAAIYPQLVHAGMTNLGSNDVMRFLGCKLRSDGKLHRAYQGEVITDLRERPEGLRIKHRAGQNSLKLYDKEGQVLRAEATINDPSEFKVYRAKQGGNPEDLDYRPLRKGVVDMKKRVAVSQAANDRYLEALAALDCSQRTRKALGDLSTHAYLKEKRCRGLNVFSALDLDLLAIVGKGDFILHGFRNADIRTSLYPGLQSKTLEAKRISARITRQIRLLRAHDLVWRKPKTHRYYVTKLARRVIGAILTVVESSFEMLGKLTT